MPDPIKSRAEYERQKAMRDEYVRQRDEFYKKAYGVVEPPAPAAPVAEDRPGLTTRFLNRAAVRGMNIAANLGEMMAGIPSPGARPVADLPAARAQGAAFGQQVRGTAEKLEAKVPEAQTPLEYAASIAGYAAPDILATMLGAKGMQAAAEGVGATSGLGRLLSPAAGAGIVRRNIAGAIASAPLVSIPGALVADGSQSPTGLLVENLTGKRPGPVARMAGDLALETGGGIIGETLISPLARILGKQAKAAPVAAAEEALTGPITTPAAPAAPRLLGRGAIPMGPIGWREREMLESAIKFAEEQRAQRRNAPPSPAPAAAPEVELSPSARLEAAAQQGRTAADVAQTIEVPTTLSPRTTRQQKNLRRQMAQSAQQIQADIDDRRAMAMPDMEATRQLEAAAEAGRQQRAAEPTSPIIPRGAANVNVLAPIGGGGLGAGIGLLTDRPDDDMTATQRALLYGAIGAGIGSVGTTVGIRAMRREAPSKIGDAWTQRQLALGQRGVPTVRQSIAEYGETGELIPRASEVDEKFKQRVANWFDQVRSAPDDPAVRSAYRAFAEETRKQYEYLTGKGVQFEFVDNPAPYKNSAEMMQDIADNNRLLVYKTQADSFHPLLSPEENDMFRAVHDYFGHAGYGHQFGPLGEENAYRVHSAMFSPEARRAMATETRGQNSWVNTRPENKAKPGTVYAEQKVALMPDDMMGPYPSELKMERPTSGVTNVEYKSSYQKGFTPGEFKRLSTIEKRLGRTAFIKRVVQPIVQSEGLPVEVANGIGSWLSEGDPGLTEAARLGFQNLPGKSIARVLGRVSQAAKQLGFFFPVPNPEGDAVALTLDFGRKMSEREYKQAISKITAADGGQRFNGTTMVALSPSKAQIVLNDGLDESAADELAALAQKALPRYTIQSATQRVTPIFGGGDTLEDAFRDYALKVGVLTPEQALAQQASIRSYENIASNRVRRAAIGASDELRAILDRFRAPSDASMGGMDAGAAGATADRLAGGAAAPEAAVRPAAADALGAGGPAVQAAPGEVTKALGGTAFDVGGAFGASLGTQFGREALPKVALGVGGYELEESVEDPRLKATGQGLQLLSMASLGYRPSKALIRSGAINVRDALAQSPQGRTALNLISRDILIDPKVKGVVELAEREMAKYRAIGLDLARQARKLGPQGDRLVSDIVENERIESRAGMDDETMKAAMAVAQKVAQEVSGLGREKVATGIISKETYDRRMASYLKRFYAAFKGAEAMQPVTIRKGNKIFRIEPERVRNENLSLEERNALGEIREASVRLGETFTEGGRNIATSRLFNALAGIDGVIPPMYKQVMDEAENARLLSEAAYASGDAEAGKAFRGAELDAKRRMKGLAQEIASGDDEYIVLPDTPKLSFLRGAVVRKDAAEYLMTMPDLGVERLGTRGLFGDLTRFWKKVHTVYNPGTHVGNFISNASKVHMGGLPLLEQLKYLNAALRDLRTYGPATKALAEAGVLERGIPTYGDMAVSGLASQKGTLQQLVETTRPETRQALTARGITPRGNARKVAGWMSQKAQQAYALEDGIYRVALYKKFLDNKMAPDEALREVERVLPGYDTRSPLLTGIKNTVSPFVMYPVKYIPSLLEDIMEHPARWVTLAALWGGLDQVSRRMYTPVQERDLRPEQRQSKSLGYLMPGSIQVDALMRPLAKALGAEPKRGEQYTFDISRFTPVNLFSGSPAPGSVVGKLLPEVPGASILQPSGFIPELASRAFNIDPFTGRKWMTGGETPMQKAQMIAEDVVLPFVTPTAVSYYGKKILKDAIPGENRAELLSDVMGLAGVRPQLVRPGVQAKYERQDFMEQLRAVKAKRNAKLRNTESPQRRKELMQEAAADLQRIRNKYYAKRIELGGGKNE
jgi:hypothetical protein